MLHTLQSILALQLRDINIFMPINQSGVSASLNRTSKWQTKTRGFFFFFSFKLKERKREVSCIARDIAILVTGKQDAHLPLQE